MPKKKTKNKHKHVEVQRERMTIRQTIETYDQEIFDLRQRLEELDKWRDKKLKELFVEEHGLIIGGHYDIRRFNRVYSGKLHSISRKENRGFYEFSCVFKVEHRNKIVSWRIAPQQIVGFEGLDYETLKKTFMYIPESK